MDQLFLGRTDAFPEAGANPPDGTNRLYEGNDYHS
jgi:hypothetical protein